MQNARTDHVKCKHRHIARKPLQFYFIYFRVTLGPELMTADGNMLLPSQFSKTKINREEEFHAVTQTLAT